MKKQEYVSPEMEIVEMKTQGFLALSGDLGGDKDPDKKPGEGFDGFGD